MVNSMLALVNRIKPFLWLDARVSDFNHLRYFRYLIGVIGLLHIFENIMNYEDYFRLVVSNSSPIPWRPNFSFLGSEFLTSIVLNQSFFLGLLLLVALFFCLLLFGVRNKVFLLVFAAAYLLLRKLQGHGTYGAELYIGLALLYMPFLPLGKFEDFKWFEGLAFRLLCLHFSLTLFETGYLKLLEPGWQSGESLYNALSGPWAVTEIFAGIPYADNRHLYKVLAWFIMLVQVCEALLLNTRYRKWAGISMIGFHFGVTLFMGLPYFSLVMIGFYLLFTTSPSD